MFPRWFHWMTDALASPAPWGWRVAARVRSWHANTHLAIIAGIVCLCLAALMQMGMAFLNLILSPFVGLTVALTGVALIEGIRGAVLIPRRHHAEAAFGSLILEVPAGLKAEATAHHVKWARWASVGWGVLWIALTGLAALRIAWPTAGIAVPTLLLGMGLIGLFWWSGRFMTASRPLDGLPAVRWPVRHLQAVRPCLDPTQQAVLDHLQAHPRWTQSDRHALESYLVPVWRATVANASDPLPCLRALIPVLPRRHAANALIDLIHAQRWDLLDAVLAELPSSWWKGTGHPEPSTPVGDALLQMSYRFPERVARYADRMGPATWRMAPEARQARQFAGAQAARDTNHVGLWTFWTMGLTTGHWRAQMIREGQVPASLPSSVLATWLESPAAILAMALNLSQAPSHQPLVQGLLQALAACPQADRLALIPTVRPYLAARAPLRDLLDGVVARCAASEQVRWQQAAPDLAWDRTRSAQRLVALEDRPAPSVSPRSRARV